ncbi:hypothetical protein D1872_266860 [compost metagenome]
MSGATYAQVQLPFSAKPAFPAALVRVDNDAVSHPNPAYIRTGLHDGSYGFMAADDAGHPRLLPGDDGEIRTANSRQFDFYFHLPGSTARWGLLFDEFQSSTFRPYQCLQLKSPLLC